MSKPVWSIWISATSFLLALLLAACAPNGTTTTGSQPSSTATTSAAPSSLPSDIPAYPGATLSSTGVEDGAKTYLYTTTDNMAKVLAFYKQQMPAKGWSEQQESGGVEDVLEFTKDPQRVIISAMAPLPTGGAGLTTFSISVSG